MAKISVWAKPPKNRRSSQVLGHLRLEHGLEHGLGQPRQQPARPDELYALRPGRLNQLPSKLSLITAIRHRLDGPAAGVSTSVSRAIPHRVYCFVMGPNAAELRFPGTRRGVTAAAQWFAPDLLRLPESACAPGGSPRPHPVAVLARLGCHRLRPALGTGHLSS